MNEVVPVDLRGGLVDIHAVCLLFGYTVQGWVGFGFYFWDGGSKTWRPPLALQCAWPLMLLAGLYWIPESPRWLVMKDRHEEAKEILKKLHSSPGDPDDTFASTEYYQINKQIAIDRTLGSSWMHMIRKPSYRKRCLLALGTTGIVQCSGVLVINSKNPVVSSSRLVQSIPDTVSRLWPNSLRHPGLQSSQAAPVSCCMADVCTWSKCYGHFPCRLVPPKQIHRFWGPGMYGHADRRSRPRGQLCTVGQ